MNLAENVGQTRLLPNVVSGWLAHGVAIVVGFVMPRLINESVGQAALGVWDLGWSLLTYLTASGLGMAAAISHRVTRHSGATDDSLRRITSTGFYCQLGLALGLGAAVGGLFFVLPALAPDALGSSASDVHWVGIYLGLAIAVAMTGDVAQGVLTGHHRTSWNEYLTIAGDIALALSMVAVVVSGGGISGLAMVTLGVRLVCELSRFVLAFRICPSLSLSPRRWDGNDARLLGRFAVKTSLGILPELVIHQGVRVLLALGAGPSALACYSRYQTVVKQIIRFMDRPARVIPPITRDLAVEGRLDEINWFRMRLRKPR